MPTISVIIPVYNAEPWLRGCVDSVLAQSFTDFELILVDDGSPDGCGAICDEYAALDARVQVIHQQNAGQAAARNRAVSRMRGSFACFVDADDVVHPQLLEILFAGLEGSGLGISCCALLESRDCPASFFARVENSVFAPYAPDEETLIALFAKPYLCWIVCGKLVPARIVKQNPFPEGRAYEDNAVALRWLLEADRIFVSDSVLYFYRVNPAGTTKSRPTEKKCRDLLWALSQQLDLIRGRGMERLYLQRLRESLHFGADYTEELEKTDRDGAQRLRRLILPRWREYLRLDFRQALCDRRMIGFFCPALKNAWHAAGRLFGR